MPTPCANGCPFYGTPQTNNLCSACFRLAYPANDKTKYSGPTTTLSSTNLAVTAPPTSASTSTSPTTTTTTTTTTSVSSSPSTQQQQKQSTPSVPTISSPSSTTSVTLNEQVESQSTIQEQVEQQQTKQKSNLRNRCAVCRKKLGLTPFVCRCAKSFCSIHRMPDTHACEFDFKAHHRHNLARSNPAVIAKKLDKI